MASSVASLRSSSLISEYQVLVRFKNDYGVRISQSRLHEGLYIVAVLKFHGPQITEYQAVNDSSVPGLTWCFNSQEVYMLCEEIARWNRQPA
ncbi:MAG: hypothetical protein QME75_05895 [Deltaproteobacteria bacterium]|nr:hypothetical protein [Deltaproteobacteria bacterium]